MYTKGDTQPAFVSLASSLILLFVGSVVVLGVITISMISVQSASSFTAGLQAAYLANTCAEVAVNKLKDDVSYSGNETVTIGSDSCQITNVTGSGNTNRTITTTATYKTATDTVTVVVGTVNPTTIITSWQ